MYKSNEGMLFPLLRLFTLSREFTICSLFWMIERHLAPDKKFCFIAVTLNLIK